MPGVLMVEAMAQVGGIAIMTLEENKNKIALFMGINNVKFRRIVVPGDQLLFEVDVVRLRSRIAQVKGVVKVDGKVVVEADLSFAPTDVSSCGVPAQAANKVTADKLNILSLKDII